MQNLIKSKIPNRKEVVAVLGVAIFLVYTWTMYVSFWKLPSWLLFLDFRESMKKYIENKTNIPISA